MKSEEKLDIEYDCYLSGGVVTLVIVKDNMIYCANVGNISACLFFTEKIYSFKFKVIELSTDHSAIKYENKIFNQEGSSTMNLNENNLESKN